MERLASRWHSAAKYFEEALRLDPRSVLTRQRLIECYLRMGNKYRQKIFEQVKALVELEPENFNYNYLLARFYDEQNEVEKAIEAYKKCIGSLAKDPVRLLEAKFDLAKLYCRNDRVKEAIPVLEDVVRMNPPSEVAYTAFYLLGGSYYIDGQYKKSILCYRKCLEIDSRSRLPTTPDAEWRLGVAYDKLYSEGVGTAISDLKTLVKLRPKSDALKYWLAWFHEKAEEKDKALELYREILESRKGNRDDRILLFVYRSLCRLYEDRGEDEKAIELLKGISLIPSRAEEMDELVRTLKRDLRVHLVYLYDMNDMDDKVVPLLRKILAADPDNAPANNYLAYWFAERGINLDESIKLVKRALEAEPDNGAYIDTYAWAIYRKASADGDEAGIRKALDELLRARKSYNKERRELGAEPLDDPVILDHIGDVYFCLGEWEKAKEFYEASLKTAAELSDERPDALPNPEQVRSKLSRVNRLLEGNPATPPEKPPSTN